jgi:hypothetical protein
MTIYEIRKMAKKMGINPNEINKMDLIRSIQIKEGNTPCYKTADNSCVMTDCLWKSDCFK